MKKCFQCIRITGEQVGKPWNRGWDARWVWSHRPWGAPGLAAGHVQEVTIAVLSCPGPTAQTHTILGPEQPEPGSSGPEISGSASSFQSFLPLALGPCTAPRAQQYLLLCMEAFPGMHKGYLSLHMIYLFICNVLFHCNGSVRTRGLVAFYSLWSIKAQTQPETGECEKSSGVWLLCLLHTPVLGAADQILERNFYCVLFSPLRSPGTSLWVLSAAKKTIWVSYNHLPAFWEWYLLLALLWYLPFYFHLFILERMLGLI